MATVFKSSKLIRASLVQAKYISFLDQAQRKATGNKFYNLSEIYDEFRVPDSACINNLAFERSFTAEARNRIQDCLTMLESNGGYQLNKLQQAIANELERLAIPEEALREITDAARTISGSWSVPLIVRSSSCFEDGAESSGAGIYESVARITNAKELKVAVLYCWRAAFSLAALSHRLRIKAFGISPLPGLIIQKYVTAEMSGVCFSADPLYNANRVFVEYVRGSTDGVEAGTGVANSFVAVPGSGTEEFIVSYHDLEPSLASELISTAVGFRNKFKKEMEYEWAFDGRKLYILQVRPITVHNSRRASKSREPVCKVFDLYTETTSINREDLGSIKPIYEHSIKKRRPIRMFADKNNVAINGSVVSIVNERGLGQINVSQSSALGRLGTTIFSIDLGPHLRSFYAKRPELNSTLKTLISSSGHVVPVIIREFASGQFSAVSMQRGAEVLLEVCRGSLIGINRGFVETESYIYDMETSSVKRLTGNLAECNRYYGFDENTRSFAFIELDSKSSHEQVVSEGALTKIAEFTIKVNRKFGNNILEWTIIDGRPVYIDNTPNLLKDELGSGLGAPAGNVVFISPGKLEGRILRIDDLQKLEYISSGPTLNVSGHLPTLEANKEIQQLKEWANARNDIVVVSKFPYTALSVLVGKVKGFIFESGPLLCHLAIIARENNTPVAVVPNALNAYKDGEEVIIV